MNWTLLTGVIFVMGGLLCSAELFRRGFLADASEIRQRRRRGSNNNRLMLLMVALAAIGYLIVEWGQS